MLRDHLARSLSRLGIDPGDFRVLKLLPLVYTAWESGEMEPVAARRIEDMARTEFELSVGGMQVLERWLAHPPSREYVLEGLRDLYDAACAIDDLEVDSSELPMLLAHAEAIARTSRRGMDQPETVSRAEERALRDVADILHVDYGEPWSELMRELQRTHAEMEEEPVTLPNAGAHPAGR